MTWPSSALICDYVCILIARFYTLFAQGQVCHHIHFIPLSWKIFLGLSRKTMKIVFLGLDNAGKTTLFRMLRDNMMIQHSPTLHPGSIWHFHKFHTQLRTFECKNVKLSFVGTPRVFIICGAFGLFTRAVIIALITYYFGQRICIDRDEFCLGETTFLAVDVGGHEQGTNFSTILSSQ